MSLSRRSFQLTSTSNARNGTRSKYSSRLAILLLKLGLVSAVMWLQFQILWGITANTTTKPGSTTTSNTTTTVPTKSVDIPPAIKRTIQETAQKFPIIPPVLNRSIAFLHIGRTAGGIPNILIHNLTKAKPPFRPDAFPLLNLPYEYYHQTQHIPYDKFTSFIITIRDPLKRAISAFRYTHPKNILHRTKIARIHNLPQQHPREVIVDPMEGLMMYSCFPDVDAFASLLGGGGGINKYGHNCTILARDAIQGQVRTFSHLYYNYQSYLKHLPSEREVFVVRNSHLYQDWNTIHDMLHDRHHDPSVILSNHRRLRSDRGPPVSDQITDANRQILCRYLKDEISEYTRLLERAVNLSKREVQESMKSLDLSCPNNSALEIDLAVA